MRNLYNKLCEAVESFIACIREYNKAVAEIEADVRLSQLAKDEKIVDEGEKRSGRIEKSKELISEILGNIVEKANSNESSCEFDYDVLVSRISLIKALDGNLPDEVVKDIADTFKDSTQALTLLKNACVSCGIKTDVIDKMIVTPEFIEGKAIQIENALFFMSQDGKSYAHFDELRKLVEELGEMI